MASVELTNGQQVDASFDVFDKKNIAFDPLPSGATVQISSSDEGVAQWAPDVAGGNKGFITTLTDKVGLATISGTITMPDGTVFTDSISVTVTNSAPGTAKFTVGTPSDEV